MALIRPVAATITLASGATAGTIAGDVSIHGIQPGMVLYPGARDETLNRGAIIQTFILSGTTGATFTIEKPVKDFADAAPAFAATPFMVESGGSEAARGFARLTSAFLTLFGLQNTTATDSKTLNLDRVDDNDTYGQLLFSRAGRGWGDLIQRTVAGIERLQLRVFPAPDSPVNALDIDTTDGTSDRLVKSSDVAISGGVADIGSARTERVRVTGTDGITSLGGARNKFRVVTFASGLTLTHSPPALSLPGGVNLTVAAGDTIIAASNQGGDWSVLPIGVQTNDPRLSNERVPVNDSVSTAKLADKAVTLAKQADVATGVIMGRVAAGAGPQSALSAAQARSVIGLGGIAANQMPYGTGANAYDFAPLTAFARTLLDDANGAAMWATLGASQAFTGSMGALNLPGGVQIRWGSSVVTLNAGGAFGIIYSSAFTTATVVAVVANGDANAAGAMIVGQYTNGWPTAAGFAVQAYDYSGAPKVNATVRVNWIAVGY